MKTIALLAAWLLWAAAACSGCGGGGDATPAPGPATAVQHIISYGQSLSLGERSEDGWPADLTMPTDYVDVGFMFADGIRSTGAASLVPFRESRASVDRSAWNIATPGETPLYGALLALRDMPGQRIASAAGRGGTGIAGLMRGTPPYQRLLDQVAAGRRLTASGYSVPAILWMQGESDAGNGAYEHQLEQLVLDLQHDVAAASGQADPVRVLLCLPFPRDIAAAQRAVAQRLPGVAIACDTAALAKSDGIHLTAAGSRAAGAAFGAMLR